MATSIAIAIVQVLFLTCRTTCVVFLPRLPESSGLPAAWAPWILMLDQVVFVFSDVVSGVYTDRVQRTSGASNPRSWPGR